MDSKKLQNIIEELDSMQQSVAKGLEQHQMNFQKTSKELEDVVDKQQAIAQELSLSQREFKEFGNHVNDSLARLSAILMGEEPKGKRKEKAIPDDALENLAIGFKRVAVGLKPVFFPSETEIISTIFPQILDGELPEGLSVYDFGAVDFLSSAQGNNGVVKHDGYVKLFFCATGGGSISAETWSKLGETSWGHFVQGSYTCNVKGNRLDIFSLCQNDIFSLRQNSSLSFCAISYDALRAVLPNVDDLEVKDRLKWLGKDMMQLRREMELQSCVPQEDILQYIALLRAVVLVGLEHWKTMETLCDFKGQKGTDLKRKWEHMLKHAENLPISYMQEAKDVNSQWIDSKSVPTFMALRCFDVHAVSTWADEFAQRVKKPNTHIKKRNRVSSTETTGEESKDWSGGSSGASVSRPLNTYNLRSKAKALQQEPQQDLQQEGKKKKNPDDMSGSEYFNQPVEEQQEPQQDLQQEPQQDLQHWMGRRRRVPRRRVP